MAISKSKARLVGIRDDIYEFEDMMKGNTFLSPIEVFHKIAEYPSSMVDKTTGSLVVGSVVDVVIKTLADGSSCYYPDVTVYRREETVQVSTDVLASSLLNLIDHIDEIGKERSREIVKALSLHNDKLACELIGRALSLF